MDDLFSLFQGAVTWRSRCSHAPVTWTWRGWWGCWSSPSSGSGTHWPCSCPWPSLQPVSWGSMRISRSVQVTNTCMCVLCSTYNWLYWSITVSTNNKYLCICVPSFAYWSGKTTNYLYLSSHPPPTHLRKK